MTKLRINDKVHWERGFTCIEARVTDVDTLGKPSLNIPGEANIPSTEHWHYPGDCPVKGNAKNQKTKES